MANRLCTTAVILALSGAVAAQSVESRIDQRFSSPDPFSIEQGSSFSASSPAKTKRIPAIAVSSVLSDIQEAISVIRQNHIVRASEPELAKSSVNSMLKSLDPHSTYYDRVEYAELMDEQRSEYFGTGTSIAEYERNGRLDTYVLSTFPGTAAERAGLRFGDRIVELNGKSVDSLDSAGVRDLMRGPRGTTVSITLERGGKTFTVSLRRDRVPQQTVSDSFMLADGVGMIRMPDGFSFTSFDEFTTTYRRLKDQGLTSLVLDLRGNPGGILDQSVKIAEKFLPEGSLIVSQRGRSAVDNRVWRSSNRNPETVPVVVLVDGDTASAAEVIAGALQDNDRAVIVGEKTFGKGLVQSVLDLPSGGGLTLTTGRYFTPSGRSLQRDYEHNGAYDYYNHAAGTAIQTGPTLTRTKRQVYGGDGITPDIRIDREEITRDRVALLDPIFHYTREVATSGGAEASGDLEAFRTFARDRWGISEGIIVKNQDFIKLRLSYDLALAHGGPVTASRVLLKSDAQVAKALQAMPQAVSFASSYTVSRASAKK
jgi:carboxyl-terminal processing protease